jgi:hypothetical protein
LRSTGGLAEDFARASPSAASIRAMVLASPTLDEERVKAYLALVEQRGYARGQRLLPKWRKLRKQLGV